MSQEWVLPTKEASSSSPNQIMHSTNTLEHTLTFLKCMVYEIFIHQELQPSLILRFSKIVHVPWISTEILQRKGKLKRIHIITIVEYSSARWFLVQNEKPSWRRLHLTRWTTFIPLLFLFGHQYLSGTVCGLIWLEEWMPKAHVLKSDWIGCSKYDDLLDLIDNIIGGNSVTILWAQECSLSAIGLWGKVKKVWQRSCLTWYRSFQSRLRQLLKLAYLVSKFPVSESLQISLERKHYL